MFSEGYSDPYGRQPEPGAGCAGNTRLVEAYVHELDPAMDGFGPVIVELYAVMDERGLAGYEVRQTATATANRLLVFRTASEELARAVYEGGASPASMHAVPAVIG